MRFYRNEDIETLVEARLGEYSNKVGRPVVVPVPIDLVAEILFDLSFLWDEIEELPGEIVWGAIRPRERLIVLNERRKAEFLNKPGLERSTKGHEVGHFDLFVDKATLAHPALFDGISGPFSLRSTPKGAAVVLLRSTPGQDLLRRLNSRADEPDEARSVNRYAAALAMPRDLIRAAAHRVDRTQWPNLYRLAEGFDVTISALSVRLQQLNLLHITPDGALHPSREEAVGQQRLF